MCTDYMKTPYFYAAVASAYIGGVVSLITLFAKTEFIPEDGFVPPIIMLSLLTLSVATMGFLFFYHPLILVLDGKRAEAISFFAKTLGTFALITLIILTVVVLAG